MRVIPFIHPLPAALAVGLLAWGLGCDMPAADGETLAVPFHVIAHRGASAYAPENTLPAFDVARELGAEEVELDVQRSADGVLVLFHDDDLAEKTGARGAVRDHPAEVLTRLDIGTWFDRTHPGLTRRYAGTTLATLEQVFARFGDAFHYHLEIKSSDPEIPALVLTEIERAGLQERVTVTSSDFEQVERVRSLDAHVPLCLLVKDLRKLRRNAKGTDREGGNALDLQKHAIDAAADAGFQQVGLPAEDLTRRIVAHARERGLEIRAWRIRGDDDTERAIRMGANGMTTNWPDRLLERIGRGRR